MSSAALSLEHPLSVTSADYPLRLELRGDFEEFGKNCQPTKAECVAMIRDIRIVTGGWRGAAQFMGVTIESARNWSRSYTNLRDSSCRLVYISWLMLCRPHCFPLTFMQMVCFGRTTLHGNPATAGEYVRPLVKNSMATPKRRKASVHGSAGHRSKPTLGGDPLVDVFSSFISGLAPCDATEGGATREKVRA